MIIKKIKARNFKSFDNLEVELNKFNILIGANASGKSNFIRLFEFIRDIKKFGLENAISMQGGIEYLKNINMNKSKIFSIEIISIPEGEAGIVANSLGESSKKQYLGIEPFETIYNFSLNHSKNKQGYTVLEDNLKLKCKFIKLEIDGGIKEKEKIGEGDIIISKSGKEIDIELPPNLPMKKDEFFPHIFSKRRKDNKLLLESTPLVIG